MRPDQQSPGDYGYDLVHEETGRTPAPPDPPDPPDRQAGSPRHPAAEPAGEEDLGYDEAHDF
ncbi:hypothetical protein [Geodermatophilus ruber]|uniref:Uncharacterized protein n=1 Tax=Geodermatophilus ruber TaxID=504800 RepID=A0A1I4FBN2_9ACTN|nr:hypothetical protein [Geodermatophilus ruber]SFL14196.1 hypothetical protein SAMN04488085_10732 [Geodermatophilus ruber]